VLQYKCQFLNIFLTEFSKIRDVLLSTEVHKRYDIKKQKTINPILCVDWTNNNTNVLFFIILNVFFKIRDVQYYYLLKFIKDLT
jgi:hypothetical protein